MVEDKPDPRQFRYRPVARIARLDSPDLGLGGNRNQLKVFSRFSAEVNSTVRCHRVELVYHREHRVTLAERHRIRICRGGNPLSDHNMFGMHLG